MKHRISRQVMFLTAVLAASIAVLAVYKYVLFPVGPVVVSDEKACRTLCENLNTQLGGAGVKGEFYAVGKDGKCYCLVKIPFQIMGPNNTIKEIEVTRVLDMGYVLKVEVKEKQLVPVPVQPTPSATNTSGH